MEYGYPFPGYFKKIHRKDRRWSLIGSWKTPLGVKEDAKPRKRKKNKHFHRMMVDGNTSLSLIIIKNQEQILVPLPQTEDYRGINQATEGKKRK